MLVAQLPAHRLGLGLGLIGVLPQAVIPALVATAQGRQRQQGIRPAPEIGRRGHHQHLGAVGPHLGPLQLAVIPEDQAVQPDIEARGQPPQPLGLWLPTDLGGGDLRPCQHHAGMLVKQPPHIVRQILGAERQHYALPVPVAGRLLEGLVEPAHPVLPQQDAADTVFADHAAPQGIVAVEHQHLVGGLLQPLQQGKNPLRQAGQTGHGEGAGHQIEVAPIEAVLAAMLLQPERQVQVVQAGLLQAQAGHLLLERTGQHSEHCRGRAIDTERGMAAGPHQQVILRAALQMLQQRLAERVDKGGNRQLLIVLRQTAPLLQGPGGHQIFPQPDDDVGPGRGIGALIHQGLQPLAMGGHLHFAIFSQGSPGEVARHQERTATEMNRCHGFSHSAVGTIQVLITLLDRL